ERSGRLTLLWPGTVDAFGERLARADGSEFQPPTRTAERAAVPAPIRAAGAAGPPTTRGT
ncbi:MAG TPA: hypothetical protein VEX12_10700, partial [Microbacterium sp.]|nr:hypothetical protein [Microbacterium sp.]